MDTWAERFDREGVWWAPVQRPADVVADPQLLGNDGLLPLPDHPGPGGLAVNGPVSFTDLPVGRAAAAVPPRLGEHTEEVLEELARGRVRRR